MNNKIPVERSESIITIEDESARYDAYTLLAQDAEDCDVEYAIHAQAEVMVTLGNANSFLSLLSIRSINQ